MCIGASPFSSDFSNASRKKKRRGSCKNAKQCKSVHIVKLVQGGAHCQPAAVSLKRERLLRFLTLKKLRRFEQ